MHDDILIVRANGKMYQFYQFVLSLYNETLFNIAYHPEASSEKFKASFDFKAHNELLAKFNLPIEDTASLVILTIPNASSLLSCIECIATALLTDSSDILMSITKGKYPGIKDGWEKDFFISAQMVFDNYKRIPELKPIMKHFKGQQ